MENHELINSTSGNTEYFTPLAIIEAARRVMGSIDLDPASCLEANEIVKAAKIYTKDDDGLSLPWQGRIFMNHPFGIAENACDPIVTGKPCNKKLCAKRGWHQIKDYPGNAGWINKLVNEYVTGNVKEACSICFASTSESWFQPLMRFPQCFLSPRTNYLDSDGKPVNGVSKGSVVTYFGTNVWGFAREFKSFGEIKVHFKV